MPKNIKKKAERDYVKFLKQIENKYGSNETNNKQLLKIARKFFGPRFIGVFSSDHIPVMKNKQIAIVNLDDSSEPGSHWISIIKVKNKTYIYDSFGRKTFKILPELIQSGNGVILETENDPEQCKLEENCGQRCIASLMVYDKYGVDGFKYI